MKAITFLGDPTHHPLAWRQLLPLLLIGSPALPANRILNLPEVFQEQTEWCWAAVSSSVLRYYGTPVSQCAIANFTRTSADWHDFGKLDCCANPGGACNYWNYNYESRGSIQEILVKWGVANSGVGRPLTIPQIRAELDAQRPFVIRWALKPSGGHFIVGYGIADSSVYYMDPWQGEGYKIADYSWMVSNSQESWAETNTMGRNPVATISSRENSASPSLVGLMTEKGLLFTYSAPAGFPVELRVFSLQGKLLRSLGIEARPGGVHTQLVSDLRLPQGGYALTIQAGEGRAKTVMFVGR